MTTINSVFAQLAYSEQALESGALERIFTEHFIETSMDPEQCAVSTVIQNVPGALLNNANTVNGIGRTAFQLRAPLMPDDACSAPPPPQ